MQRSLAKATNLMHVLLTTNDVTHENFFTRFFLGCFNLHIVHHLFLNINHVYYPEIAKEFRQFAKEHELPYRNFPLVTSLKNHYLLLKQNRVEENIFEEDM